MKVLIVTHSEDHHGLVRVADVLRERGHDPIRLDTDLYPTEVRLTTPTDPGAGELVLGDRRIALGDIGAVWNRRFAIGKGIPSDLDPQLRSAAVEEARQSLRWTLASLDAFTVDPQERVFAAKNKPLQLHRGRQAGLDVPDTLVTNDPDAVRELVRRHPEGVICKMMTSFAVYDEAGHEQVVFTNTVGEDDLDDLDGLSRSPMAFQEKLPKELELRVTVIGRRVFTAAIDSQSSDRARDDWRRDGARMVTDWREHELPAAVESSLLTLMDRFGLQYGAADFILTPDGRWVFLEVNPAGEWFWLERQTPHFPLSQALAEVLVDPAARRG
jgi:glutathione synthase/RimK-type ligase-like ATP-grasp enzyme